MSSKIRNLLYFLETNRKEPDITALLQGKRYKEIEKIFRQQLLAKNVQDNVRYGMMQVAIQKQNKHQLLQLYRDKKTCKSLQYLLLGLCPLDPRTAFYETKQFATKTPIGPKYYEKLLEASIEKKEYSLAHEIVCSTKHLPQLLLESLLIRLAYYRMSEKAWDVYDRIRTLELHPNTMAAVLDLYVEKGIQYWYPFWKSNQIEPWLSTLEKMIRQCEIHNVKMEKVKTKDPAILFSLS